MTARGFRRLVSFGTVVVDIVAFVDDLPGRGADVLARAGLVEAGGGRNVLVAAARQGLDVAYAGLTGSGPMGELARTALAADGIALLQPPDPDTDTGFSLGLVDSGGERTFVSVVGAEGRLTPERVAAIELGPDDAVHMSGYTLQHEPNRRALLQLLDRLDPAIPLFYDPGPLGHRLPAEVAAAVARRVTWWSGNATEAMAAAGADDRPKLIDVAEVAARLARSMPQAGIVVRIGRDGCYVLAPGGSLTPVPAFRVDALDTTGAGDTHLGVFIAALAQGRDPADAARRANAAAAISVTRKGPAAAPGAMEVEVLLREAAGSR